MSISGTGQSESTTQIVAQRHINKATFQPKTQTQFCPPNESERSKKRQQKGQETCLEIEILDEDGHIGRVNPEDVTFTVFKVSSLFNLRSKWLKITIKRETNPRRAAAGVGKKEKQPDKFLKVIAPPLLVL